MYYTGILNSSNLYIYYLLFYAFLGTESIIGIMRLIEGQTWFINTDWQPVLVKKKAEIKTCYAWRYHLHPVKSYFLRNR